MDTEQLNAFILVAETKNFTKTAEVLHLAQSTVTSRIKTLEDIVGKQLLYRSNKTVSLTPAGEIFLPYAFRMKELAEKSVENLQQQGLYEERLVLGGPSSVWRHLLYPYLKTFRESNPEVAVELLTHSTENTIQKVLDGIIHVGVVYAKPRHPMIHSQPILDDEYVLAGAEKYNNLGNLETLYSKDFILNDWGNPFMNWFYNTIGNHYIPAFKINQTSIVLKMLLDGSGFGFIPQSIIGPYVKDGSLIKINFELPSQPPTHKIFLVYLKKQEQSKAVQLGLDLLKHFL
ncbi:DNA-binding transcriptional LysR family regulator [Salirhabdus euzebyi]|uniref:DNA-binding transcriptional LysR family regulator n=1 Tax=Salirhabdus euzebyi TaxID=394506 RepID=A0A841Q418_9BACI|nr:LysR family transcriptional regulator [Salirhabdus euzebyi]MBB6453135.1 DNA-binding transcriptional LysR family regulator [Salirhabdus euzebyi]